MRSVCLAITLLVSLASTSASQARGPVDSVVLKRKDDVCILRCESMADVILRRGELPAWMLDTIDRRAERSGFYQLPSTLRGVPWCGAQWSDALTATLSVYRRDSVTTADGYHHCAGRVSDSVPVTPPEKQRLLDLEALIDSVAGRKGRFR